MNGKHSDVLIESARSRTDKGCTDEGAMKRISGRVSFAQNTLARVAPLIHAWSATIAMPRVSYEAYFSFLRPFSYLIDERQQRQRQCGRHEWCIEYAVPRNLSHNSVTNPPAALHVGRVSLCTIGTIRVYFTRAFATSLPFLPFVPLPHYYYISRPRDHIRAGRRVKDGKRSVCGTVCAFRSALAFSFQYAVVYNRINKKIVKDKCLICKILHLSTAERDRVIPGQEKLQKSQKSALSLNEFRTELKSRE